MSLEPTLQLLQESDRHEIGSRLVEAADRLLLAGETEVALIAAEAAFSGPLALSQTSSERIWLESSLLPIVCYLASRGCPATSRGPEMSRSELTQHLAEHGDDWLSMMLSVKALHQERPGATWSDDYFARLQTAETPGRFETFPPEIALFVNDLHRILQQRVIDELGVVPPDLLGGVEQFSPILGMLSTDRLPVADYAVGLELDFLADALTDLSARTGLAADYMSQECHHMLAILYLSSGRREKAIEQLRLKFKANPDNVRSHLPMYPQILDLIGKGVLKDDLDIGTEQIEHFLALLDGLKTEPPKPAGLAPVVPDWQDRLQTFDAEQMADNEYLAQIQECESPRWRAIEQFGSCSRPGATANEIAALEERIGCRLPESYRSFLATTNGLIVPKGLCDLWPAQQVDWFRVHEPEMWEGWCNSEVDSPDELYFQYGRNQDCIHYRSQYIKSALQISSTMDGEVMVLVPDVKAENGEWEAWCLSYKLPGANRYRSFYDMMRTEVLDANWNW